MKSEKENEIISYIHSEDFMVDTMLHREGDQYVYMEAIPRDRKQPMLWLNGRLLNYKHIVKHVGSDWYIASLIAKKLKIKKVDRKATMHCSDGSMILSRPYHELHQTICNLPKIIEEK